MEDWQRILHKTASKNLPIFPKKPHDFYIAILPHNRTPRHCQWKDFLWLKARGKNTIGQITNANAKRTDSRAILICGDRKVSDNTQLRELANRDYGDLLVFWTIVDTEHVLSHEVRPFVWDVAKKMEEYWETNILPSNLDEDWSMSDAEPEPPTVKEVEDMLQPLRSRNTDLALKVEMNGDHPMVKCQDCPFHKNLVGDAAALSNLNLSIDAHLRSFHHTSNFETRMRSKEALSTTLTSLKLRNPNANFGYKITNRSGARTTMDLLDHQIFCMICPTWIYTMRGNSIILARSAAEEHLKTSDHKRRAVLSEPQRRAEDRMQQTVARPLRPLDQNRSRTNFIPTPAKAESASAKRKRAESTLDTRMYPKYQFDLKADSGSYSIVCEDCENFSYTILNEVNANSAFVHVVQHCNTSSHKTNAMAREARETKVAVSRSSHKRTLPWES